jgi:glutaredoxin
MTNASHLRAILILAVCVAFLAVTFGSAPAQKSSKAGPEMDKTVVVTVFTSSECPFCENVKELVDDLKTTLPIKIEMFDINRPADYDLFSKIEATHKGERFAVPLVIVGDTVLMGQSQIFGKLEDTIRKAEVNGTSRVGTKLNHKKIAADEAPSGHGAQSNKLQSESSKMKIINDDPKADPSSSN